MEEESQKIQKIFGMIGKRINSYEHLENKAKVERMIGQQFEWVQRVWTFFT